MPQDRDCDYCGDAIEPGTGTMFVRTNGTTVHYCSSKCEKNADLGREARDLEWTEAGGARDEDEAVADSEATETASVDEAAVTDESEAQEVAEEEDVGDGAAEEAAEIEDAATGDDEDDESSADEGDEEETEEAEA